VFVFESFGKFPPESKGSDFDPDIHKFFLKEYIHVFTEEEKNYFIEADAVSKICSRRYKDNEFAKNRCFKKIMLEKYDHDKLMKLQTSVAEKSSLSD